MTETIITQQLIAKLMKKINKPKVKRNLKRAGVILAILLFFVVAKNVAVHGNVYGQEFEPTYATNVKVPERFKVVTIEIQGGTTAWDIQGTLVPKSEVEEALKLSSRLNNRDMNNIKQGESLKFLVPNIEK